MNRVGRLAVFGMAVVAGCADSGDRAVDESELPLQRLERTQALDAAERAGTTVQRPARVESTFIGPDGKAIGTLSIEPLQESGVRMALHVEGLEPGKHALHIHEHGRCEPPDFTSAGRHFDPVGVPHGFPDADSDRDDPDHHAGDMLNQTADDLGTMDEIIINRAVNLNHAPNRLLDEDGSALVIHARPDDYESQPAGDSGARVACAEILQVSSRGD